MNDFECGVLVGGVTAIIGTMLLLAIIITNQDKILKSDYVKCGIANYNTTSGAFEFKPQYKILGE
jgi:hypothetical protein